MSIVLDQSLSDSPGDRKARGAFFTPSELTDFIVDWAIRSPFDRVLEPSCGEAAFLVAASNRLRKLGSPSPHSGLLSGIDIFPSSVNQARIILESQNIESNIQIGDFFAFDPPSPAESYDVVVGNPPYIRYQQFSGSSRALALKAALRQGVRLSGLASSWAAFIVHAAAFLKPEGRLGLVIPAELLSVNYASGIRRYLLNRFGKVRLVMFEERVFPGVLEEVILLLAEGNGGAEKFELYQAKNLSDLKAISSSKWIDYSPSADEKWTPALLPALAFDMYQRLVSSENVEQFSDWGNTFLGIVTGNNSYFALNKDIISKYELCTSDYLPLIPPGSQHLRGLSFTKKALEVLAANGKRCFLFYPQETDGLSKGAKKYIKDGEQLGIAEAYKCRIRDSWWQVPLVDSPDLIFTYMNHDRPQVIHNDSSSRILNSVYGVRLVKGRCEIGRRYLPLVFLNSLTLLGAEISGRSYGGGLLKHEPREVDSIPVPSLALINYIADKLTKAKPEVSVLLRKTNAEQAIEVVDQIVLCEGLGIEKQEVQALREARKHLIKRRIARGRASNVQDK